MGKIIGLIPQPHQTKEQEKKPAPKPVKKPSNVK